MRKTGIEKQVLNYRKDLDESEKDNDFLNNHTLNIDSTSINERKFQATPSNIDNVVFQRKLLPKTGEQEFYFSDLLGSLLIALSSIGVVTKTRKKNIK